MKQKRKRLEDTLKSSKLLQTIQKYTYLETFFLVGIFLLAGYLIAPDDLCLTKQNIPYLLILLSIITLFHGFESGMLALGVIAVVMWINYPVFPYVSFLINLLMVMIFSEFHYYWTKQIKELTTQSNYTATKLNELANAFYSLKISHDQLEKNHVLKPMSIRSAIEEILENKTNSKTTQEEYFNEFLDLLEKSFHLHGGFIIYAKDHEEVEYLGEQNSLICYSSTSERYTKEEIFHEYLVDKSINYKQVVYVSDNEGNPALRKDIENSKFLATIPIIYENKMLAILVIEKMPFMAFNRENLISLSILFEYLLISGLKQDILNKSNKLLFIKDKTFRYEYIRTAMLEEKYKTHSTLMILKMDNEIQSIRVFEKAQKMLRSLDLLTTYKHNNIYFILFLFPLNDKAAAIGFLNRLLGTLDDENDKTFEHMFFDIHNNELIEKYILEYHND